MKIIDADPQDCLKILRANPYFDGLSGPVLEELARHVRMREYQRGEVLLWEGDSCDGLYILEIGCAKIFKTSPQGRQYIIRVLQEGDTFAEVPAFDEGPNPVNVEALETSRVWVIDSMKLRELIDTQPAFAKKVLVNYGRMLRGMVKMVSEMAFYQVTHRLARLIAEMRHEDTTAQWTQEHLAARLGTVREVVARSIREMERSGAIRVEDRRFLVVDEEVFSQWLE